MCLFGSWTAQSKPPLENSRRLLPAPPDAPTQITLTRSEPQRVKRV